MIIKACGIILGIILAILIVLFYKKDRNILSPAIIFLLLEFLTYVPGLLILTEESSIVFTDKGSQTLVINELFYVLCVLLGLDIGNRIQIKGSNRVYDASLFNIFVLFAIGFAAKLYVFQKIGGIGFVINNPRLAYQMQSHGFGIYTQFYKFMLLAILAMCEKAVIHKEEKKYVGYALLLILIYIFSFLVYTNRTPGLIVLLIVFFIIHFEVRPFNIERLLNGKVLLVLVFIFGASYLATKSRNPTLNTVSNSVITDMVRNLSDDGRDMFVYEYFSTHPKWFGAGYLNILPSLRPGVIDKPVTDDGLYLVNLIRGYDVSINDTFLMLPSPTGSVPFSTPGYMFANFGLFGIMVGGVLMGTLIALSYRRMQISKNAFSVAVYFYMIYSFGLSTGRMVPVIITIVFIELFKVFLNYRIVLKLR